MTKCPECKGTGEVEKMIHVRPHGDISQDDEHTGWYKGLVTCTSCNGTGRRGEI